MLDTILVLALITTLAAFALPTRAPRPATPTPDTRTEAERIIAALEAGQVARS